MGESDFHSYHLARCAAREERRRQRGYKPRCVCGQTTVTLVGHVPECHAVLERWVLSLPPPPNAGETPPPRTPKPRTKRPRAPGPTQFELKTQPLPRSEEAYVTFVAAYEGLREAVASITYFLDHLPNAQPFQPQGKNFARELRRAFDRSVETALVAVRSDPRTPKDN
jgi:hypothetical protein